MQLPETKSGGKIYSLKIKKQKIVLGKSFHSIQLNNCIEPDTDGLQIKWSVHGNKNIIVKIDSLQTANFFMSSQNWYGSDTITFTALINDSISISANTVFTVSTPSPVYGRSLVKPFKDLLVTGINDVISIATSPARWDSTDFIKFPLILLGTYTLMVSDELTHKWISDDGRAKPTPLMDFGTYFGESVVSQLAALGFGLYGVAFNDDEFLQIGLEIYESYFIANNINSIMKRTFGRTRPYENKGPYEFNPFSSGNNPAHSFPSGHSTLAFSLSSVIASHTKNTLLKILIYTPAVITAISRVYNNKHWLSDVFMGSAVGYLVGSYLVSRHSNQPNNNYSIGLDGNGRICFQINF